jgi:hypothetical protein
MNRQAGSLQRELNRQAGSLQRELNRQAGSLQRELNRQAGSLCEMKQTIYPQDSDQNAPPRKVQKYSVKRITNTGEETIGTFKGYDPEMAAEKAFAVFCKEHDSEMIEGCKMVVVCPHGTRENWIGSRMALETPVKISSNRLAPSGKPYVCYQMQVRQKR